MTMLAELTVGVVPDLREFSMETANNKRLRRVHGRVIGSLALSCNLRLEYGRPSQISILDTRLLKNIHLGFSLDIHLGGSSGVSRMDTRISDELSYFRWASQMDGHTPDKYGVSIRDAISPMDVPLGYRRPERRLCNNAGPRAHPRQVR